MPVSLSRVVVIGSSNTDLVVACSRLPKKGETILGGEFHCVSGGKGANQAVAAARAGASVTFIGACGDDDFGTRAITSLKREQINLSHFHIRRGIPSGVALILIGGKSRDNMIAVAKSANDTVSASDIRSAQPEIVKAGAILAQLEIPLEAVLAAAEAAHQSEIPFLLNPAPARALPRKLWKWVDTLTPNQHEALLLSGESTVERAGKKLLSLGCQNIVITRGSRGALLINHQGMKSFPAHKVKAIDTVGAGDCFSAWLAVGRAEGLPIESSITRALKAASFSVTRPGAQSSMPYRREVL